MKPITIKGNIHTDFRGSLYFNNEFDASPVKRVYFIQNKDTKIVRAWQGHRIEQRWFSAVQGSFEIKLIEVDDWEKPSKNKAVYSFILRANQLDVLHIPQGYISSIQALDSDSKLLVMADYLLGEIKDEYRFDADYFKK
ncbi:WxcM-like domain-containing protein [Flavobacterium sp.]|uniref:WxcM-like domain-containing protein n=1 Tax=Flavobacterium sp. TaxID=239 RepID=UPI001B4EDB02|nr:WxcM-like domain-containing protein [Flavobacterium sp.]MBP6182589.1 WxcM-like domain-containing protein [Flavobacterium sp.]